MKPFTRTSAGLTTPVGGGAFFVAGWGARCCYYIAPTASVGVVRLRGTGRSPWNPNARRALVRVRVFRATAAAAAGNFLSGRAPRAHTNGRADPSGPPPSRIPTAVPAPPPPPPPLLRRRRNGSALRRSLAHRVSNAGDPNQFSLTCFRPKSDASVD